MKRLVSALALLLAGCELWPEGDCAPPCARVFLVHEPIAGPYTVHVRGAGQLYEIACPMLEGPLTCDGHIIQISGLDTRHVSLSIDSGPWADITLIDRPQIQAPQNQCDLCTVRVGQAR